MAQTLEERVAELEGRIVEVEERLREKEAAELQLKLNTDLLPDRPGVIGRTRPDFLEKFVGIHANSPLAAEVFREVAAERERQREEAQIFEETGNEEA